MKQKVAILLLLVLVSTSAHTIDEKVNNVTIIRTGFTVNASSPGGGWDFIVNKPGAADYGFGLMHLPPMNTNADKAVLSLMLSAQTAQSKLPKITYSANATVNTVCQIISAQIDNDA